VVKIIIIFLIDTYLLINGLFLIVNPKQLLLVILALVFLYILILIIKRMVIYSQKKSKGKGPMLKYMFKPFVTLHKAIVNNPRVPGFKIWPESRFIFQFIFPMVAVIYSLSLITIANKQQLGWSEISPLLFHLTTFYIFMSVFVEPIFSYFRSRSVVILLETIKVNLAVKLVYLFLFFFTFLTPVGWLMIFSLVLIQAISKVRSEKARVVN